MKSSPIPFRRAAFVCTQAREDGRAACANPGAAGAEIAAALKKAVEEAGLKGKVRVVRAGCLGLCAQGPNVFLYPEGTHCAGVALSDVPELVRRLGEGL